jgi:hypothetical protein
VYELRLARSARKELEALPDAALGRVARQLDALPATPRPRGCKKLRGATNLGVEGESVLDGERREVRVGLGASRPQPRPTHNTFVVTGSRMLVA